MGAILPLFNTQIFPMEGKFRAVSEPKEFSFTKSHTPPHWLYTPSGPLLLQPTSQAKSVFYINAYPLEANVRCTDK